MAGSPHLNQHVEAVPCAVVTVSDSRTKATDRSGSWLLEELSRAGHRLVSYEILPDNPERVREHIAKLCATPDCSAVLVTGGTGIATRDSTYEAISGLLDKRLDGFGELFRMLSYEAIGPAAMLSRAVAGVAQNTAVFCMPGSPDAVQLAVSKLILPVIGHIVWLVRPPEGS